MRSNYRRIGDYVTKIKLKNTDDSISDLKGISFNKHFMPSVANVNGTDLGEYRVVKKNQLAFNPMHVGRDEVLPISMLEDNDPIIISPAYVVFEIKKEEDLLPAYLMMWCRRSEFDRKAWFMTDNSVRGGFSWADFCNMELAIPSTKKQHEIVCEYNVVRDRIVINEQLIQKLEEMSQDIYRHWFVNFEFPISKAYAESIGKPELEGMPYKSSCGQMVYCEDLGKDIPSGWQNIELGKLSDIKAGGDRPIVVSDAMSDECDIPIYSNSTEDEGLYGYTNQARVFESSITISARGGIGYTVLRLEPYFPIIRLIVVIPKTNNLLNYLFESIKLFQFDGIGSAQEQLTAPDIKGRKVVLPSREVLEMHQKLTKTIMDNISEKRAENKFLDKFLQVILQKMSKA